VVDEARLKTDPFDRHCHLSPGKRKNLHSRIVILQKRNEGLTNIRQFERDLEF